MEQQLTHENWTYCHYKSSQLKAFISLGGELSEDVQLLYMVTLTDHDHNELYQSTHKALDNALADINSRYQSWDFVDAEAGPSGEGCTSCEAH